MAYANVNYKTKKALKEAVANGEDVYVQPNLFGGNDCYRHGKAAIEGPHFPAAHTWWADCDVDDEGRITKVR